MCVPCAAPAAEILWPLILGILMFIGITLWVAGPIVGRILAFTGMFLWRWVTGARIFKDLGVREDKLPPRRLARHVHASGRILLTMTLVLSLASTAFFWAAVSLYAGTGTALAVKYLHARRTARLRELGVPVRAKLTVGAER